MYPNQNYDAVLDGVSDAEFRRLFTRSADGGLGIELNFNSFHKDGTPYTWEKDASVLRPYAIAKECGCRFCFGSDAHHPDELASEKRNAEHIIDLLSLTESDKFDFKSL